MKIWPYALILATLVLCFVAFNVLAGGSPHWIKHDVYAELLAEDSGYLSVHFKASGLGATAEPVAVTATATWTGTWGCKNGGGQYPDASNKSEQSSSASMTGYFYVQNGMISGDLILAPEVTDFTCPPGQVLTLAAVEWSDVTIHADPIANDAIVKGAFGYCDPDWCLVARR
jgi:hypothetical protein